MSRRRRRPTDEPGRPRIDVWCTCKGQCRAHRIGYLLDYRARPVRLTTEGIGVHDKLMRMMGGHPGPAPEPVERGGFAYFAPEYVPPATRPDGGHTFTFVCRRCGRRPQCREEVLASIVDTLRVAGGLFDVSALD